MKKSTKIGAGLAALAAVATGAIVATAWGPERTTYTMEQPADKVTFNSITNNPLLMNSTNVADCGEYDVRCDERYFVSASEYQEANPALSVWSDKTTVEDGKEYVVNMYVHNDAASNLGLVAENVTASVVLPTEAANSITVTGAIESSNADPFDVWDDTTFVSANGEDFTLSYVDGTAEYTNCDEDTRDEARHCTKNRSFKLSDELFYNGVLLGYNQMDGKIPGCIGYSGWVSFRVKAEFPKKDSSYEIVKDVKIKGQGEFADTVNAKSGDTLVYRITYTNTGATELKNVVVHDVLPVGVTYVPGSTNLVNANNPDGLNLNDALFSDNGVNIGNYLPGGNAMIYFNVTVDDLKAGDCEDKILRNLAESTVETPEGIRTEIKTDTADVYIEGLVCEEGYTLDKMVRLEKDTNWSEKVTAQPGEKVYYRIRFHNTGEMDLSNVIVSDKLPEGVKDASEVKYGVIVDGKDSETKVGEGFFTDAGMNIGTVKAGETVGIYFSATVDSALADECEGKELVNTVTGKYGDKDSSIKTDIATVWVDGRLCTEEEHPNYELNKMVQVKGSDKWSENVTVKANDEVRYRIQFKNTGDVTLDNVVISDVLPKGMNYVKGSTMLYNAENTDGKTMGDELVNGGLNIGSVAAGSEATIYFYAKVDAAFDGDCEAHKLTNIAKSTYNNDESTEKTDAADVTTEAEICEDVPQKYPNTGKESMAGAIIAVSALTAAAAGYVISRKK